MLAITLYNLCSEALNGQIPTEELTNRLNETLTKNTHSLDLLADTLFQLDIETEYSAKDRRGAFISTLKHLVKENILSPGMLLDRFEFDTLAQVGVVSDKNIIKTSYNRLRTKLYFKQKKYNLLREESEGFARILTELARLDESNIEEVLRSTTSIIGAYLVDPNRVLDLALEHFEHCTRKNFNIFVRFLNEFYKSNSKILQLVLLKLSFYSSSKEDIRYIPQSLYRLIALLIKTETLDLDDIYPCLVPSDAKILDYHKKLVEESRSYAKKYAMAVVGDEKPNKTVIERLDDLDRHLLEVDNQKINLCAHLIDVGDWQQAHNIARRLPEYYCYSDIRVADAACSLINYIIDPVYRECASARPLGYKIKPIAPKEGGPKQVQNIKELCDEVFPMLSAIGPFLSADKLLLTKIIRILTHTLLQDSNGESNGYRYVSDESPYYYQIVDVIDESILPSIAMTSGSSPLVRELWTLLRLFSYHTRYKLYFNWKAEGSNPRSLRNRGQILLRAKHLMKRLSKDTIRFTGRNLAKLCCANPIVTLNYVLIQIQSYDNLITHLIDSLRFLPPIALDALVYCIIESLSDPHKDKKSYDGMALAQWLTSLSNFSANFILRYKVEFASFLEYIANQLKAGNSLDLVLLTDLIQKMTGIETIQEITEDRVEALIGGNILRTECAYFNQVKNTRKTSARLKDALIESRLAMPLCISMAQLRESLLLVDQDKNPLKLIGKLYDQCQDTLVQYGVFLSTNLNIDDYINFLPPLEKLMTEHKLDPDRAFLLARPMIFHKIKSKFEELKSQVLKDLVVEEGESPELSPQNLGIKYVEAARSVIDPIAETIQPYLVEKYGSSNLSPKLFVIFWTLSMCDIEVPVACYDREITRLKNLLNELSRAGADDDMKKRKEKDRYTSLISKLKQEQSEQIEHVNFVRIFLESEKNNLFSENSSYDNVYLESRQFVQHCSYARSLLTAIDAVYSARFMLLLHELKVANYPTIICLDRLLCDVTYMMGACTENEANHYGRFLCNILKTTSLWHSSPTVYSELCEQFPGSIINTETNKCLPYEAYRDICYKWHYRLTKSFSYALESNNYVQIRNALNVMTKIIDYYPAIRHFGKGISKKIEEVRNSEKESRQDLYALATSYAGKLEEKKPMLTPECNFHIAPPPDSKTAKKRHSSSSSEQRHKSSRREQQP